MKYAKKFAVSMLAALAVASPAVPAFNSFSSVNVSAVNTDYRNFSTYSYSDVKQPVLYRTCFKVNWSASELADYYLIQICKTDGTLVSSLRAGRNETSAVIPYSTLPLSRDIYGKITDTDYSVSVIAVTGSVNEAGLVPYLSPSSRFTLKQDMSEYENYGAPCNIKAKCGTNSLTLSWENSSDDGSYTNTFRVTLTNSAGKKVISIDTKATSVSISGLLYGNTYTAAIENTNYSAVTYASITIKPSDTAASVPSSESVSAPIQMPMVPSNTTVPVMEMPSSDNTLLSAPKNLKASSGVKMITLSWNKVSGADAYRVYIYDESKQAYVRYKTVRSNRCTVTGLVGDKNYKFRVAGVVYDKNTKKYIPGYACKAITARSAGDGKVNYVAPQRKES